MMTDFMLQDLRTLLEVMEEFGKVILISTTESMSGMSQALTVKTPLRVKLLEENEKHGSMHVTELLRIALSWQ